MAHHADVSALLKKFKNQCHFFHCGIQCSFIEALAKNGSEMWVSGTLEHCMSWEYEQGSVLQFVDVFDSEIEIVKCSALLQIGWHFCNSF